MCASPRVWTNSPACHHLQQKSVGCDVEWNAQKTIGAALVELQAQASAGHVELEERMAWREVHLGQVGYVPCAYDDASGVGIVADIVDGLCDLVDRAAVVIGP